MATPGWYPDPSGQAGSYRYWDGGQWSAELADNPYGPPPGAAPTGPPPSTPPSPPPSQPGGSSWGQSGNSPFDAPTAYPGQSTPAEPTQVSPMSSSGGVPPAPPPYQPAPGSGAYPQPPQSGQPPQPGGGYGNYPPGPGGWPGATPSYGTPPGGGSGGSGKTIGIVLGAVALILLLGVGTFFAVRAVSGDDDDTKAGEDPTSSDTTTETTSDPTTTTSDPTTSDTPTSSTPPGPVQPTAQQCQGGTPTIGGTGTDGRFLTGGGLRMPKVAGFNIKLDQAAAFRFADGALAPSKVIVPSTETVTGWVAVYLIGGLNTANGYDSPEQAAEIVMTCMTQDPNIYNGFSGREDVTSQEITVDGQQAWELVSEIRVDQPDLGLEGDVARVVVVDTGNPDEYGLFLSVVPIGDNDLIAQQEAQAKLILVD